MKYLYYPGCSLEGTAKEYDISTRALAAALEMELVELEDWTCCGANGRKLGRALAGAGTAGAEPGHRRKNGRRSRYHGPVQRLLPEPENRRGERAQKVGGHGEHQPLPGAREPVAGGKKHHQALAGRAFEGCGAGKNPGESRKAPGGLDPGALLRLPVPSPPTWSSTTPNSPSPWIPCWKRQARRCTSGTWALSAAGPPT